MTTSSRLREVAQRPPGELLAAAAGVDVRGVERRDAGLERLADDRAGRVLVEDPRVPAAVGVAPAHAAEDHPGDVETGVAELRVAHGASLAARAVTPTAGAP